MPQPRAFSLQWHHSGNLVLDVSLWQGMHTGLCICVYSLLRTSPRGHLETSLWCYREWRKWSKTWSNALYFERSCLCMCDVKGLLHLANMSLLLSQGSWDLKLDLKWQANFHGIFWFDHFWLVQVQSSQIKNYFPLMVKFSVLNF